jgi:hypothetical protein
MNNRTKEINLLSGSIAMMAVNQEETHALFVELNRALSALDSVTELMEKSNPDSLTDGMVCKLGRALSIICMHARDLSARGERLTHFHGDCESTEAA